MAAYIAAGTGVVSGGPSDFILGFEPGLDVVAFINIPDGYGAAAWPPSFSKQAFPIPNDPNISDGSVDVWNPEGNWSVTVWTMDTGTSATVSFAPDNTVTLTDAEILTLPPPPPWELV